MYFRAQTSAATAVTSSTIGNVSQTPSTPSTHASGNRIGGTAITPRSSERTNPCTVLSDALKNAAVTMFTPANRKPVK